MIDPFIERLIALVQSGAAPASRLFDHMPPFALEGWTLLMYTALVVVAVSWVADRANRSRWVRAQAEALMRGSQHPPTPRAPFRR